ncbi:hypothetical protein SPWS13_3578 [Shewanella putrefaciens]|nr:hypothetical protein SPWS13_3578 [Shewanella putrefaciens]
MIPLEDKGFNFTMLKMVIFHNELGEYSYLGLEPNSFFVTIL